jgi:hypothetical protein
MQPLSKAAKAVFKQRVAKIKSKEYGQIVEACEQIDDEFMIHGGGAEALVKVVLGKSDKACAAAVAALSAWVLPSCNAEALGDARRPLPSTAERAFCVMTSTPLLDSSVRRLDDRGVAAALTPHRFVSHSNRVPLLRSARLLQLPFFMALASLCDAPDVMLSAARLLRVLVACLLPSATADCPSRVGSTQALGPGISLPSPPMYCMLWSFATNSKVTKCSPHPPPPTAPLSSFFRLSALAKACCARHHLKRQVQW